MDIEESLLKNMLDQEKAQLSSDDQMYLDMIDFLNMLEELEGK